MAGHFPFVAKRGVRYGLAPRMSMAAFFEHHGFNNELQERYYQWWYEWAKNFVLSDEDLRLAKGVKFNKYPLGQSAEQSFHLNDKVWATRMAELGALIRESILPRLDEQALEALVHQHQQLVEELDAEAQREPRTPAPDVGYFRHT